MRLEKNSGLYRVVQALGYILHPAVVMLVAVALASGLLRRNIGQTMLDVGILLLGLLPGLLYIFVKTRRGEFSHYHLVIREERHSVLILLFVGILISFGLYIWGRAPDLMLRSMVAGLICGVGAILITRVWKISLHATVAMGCAALFLPLGWIFVIAFAVAGLIVGLARLIVHHHSAAQVIGGWVYGFGFTSLLLYWLGVLNL